MKKTIENIQITDTKVIIAIVASGGLEEEGALLPFEIEDTEGEYED